MKFCALKMCLKFYNDIQIPYRPVCRLILKIWNFENTRWRIASIFVIIILPYFGQNDPIFDTEFWELRHTGFNQSVTHWLTDWINQSINCVWLHRVSKNKQIYFCYNYLKLPPNATTFGTKMANCLKLYEVHSFSTSSNSCQCTTVLNANVPNCHITW